MRKMQPLHHLQRSSLRSSQSFRQGSSHPEASSRQCLEGRFLALEARPAFQASLLHRLLESVDCSMSLSAKGTSECPQCSIALACHTDSMRRCCHCRSRSKGSDHFERTDLPETRRLQPKLVHSSPLLAPSQLQQ